MDKMNTGHELGRKMEDSFESSGSRRAAETLDKQQRDDTVEQSSRRKSKEHANTIENLNLQARDQLGREIPQCIRCAERLPPGQGSGYCLGCKELRHAGKIPPLRRERVYKSRKCEGINCRTYFSASGQYCEKCKGDEMKHRSTEQKREASERIVKLRQTMSLDEALAKYNKEAGDTIVQSQYYLWRSGKGLAPGGNTTKAKKNKAQVKNKRLETALGVAQLCLTRKVDAETGITQYLAENLSAEKITLSMFTNQLRAELPKELHVELIALYLVLGAKKRSKAAKTKTRKSAVERFTPNPEQIEFTKEITALCAEESFGAGKAIELYTARNPDKKVFSTWVYYQTKKRLDPELPDEGETANPQPPASRKHPSLSEKIAFARKFAEFYLNNNVSFDKAIKLYADCTPPEEVFSMSTFYRCREQFEPELQAQIDAHSSKQRGRGPSKKHDNPPTHVEPLADVVESSPMTDQPLADAPPMNTSLPVLPVLPPIPNDQTRLCDVLSYIVGAGIDDCLKIQEAATTRRKELPSEVIKEFSAKLLALGVINEDDVESLPGLLGIK